MKTQSLPQTGRTTSAKMSILSDAILRFNAISIKVSMKIFKEMYKHY